MQLYIQQASKDKVHNPSYNNVKRNYSGVSLTKKVKVLYTKNYETLLKDVEKTNKWMGNLCSWIKRTNFVSLSILPPNELEFSEIPIKISGTLFIYFFAEDESY